MDKSKKKTFSIGWSLLHSLVGALVAVLAFFPITWITLIALGVLLRALGLGGLLRALGIEPFWNGLRVIVAAYDCLLPAVGLGGFGGFIGSVLARKPFKRIGPWIGAVAGGLIVALLTALFILSITYGEG